MSADSRCQRKMRQSCNSAVGCFIFKLCWNHIGVCYRSASGCGLRSCASIRGQVRTGDMAQMAYWGIWTTRRLLAQPSEGTGYLFHWRRAKDPHTRTTDRLLPFAIACSYQNLPMENP